MAFADAGLETVVLTSKTATAGPSVRPLISNWHDPKEILAAITSTGPASQILWQYVPHMYGRGGVNYAITRVMEELRRQGVRQTVLAHEIAAPLSWQPQRAWYAIRHRRQWQRIMQIADKVGISTEAWLERWSQDEPRWRDKFFLMPSPSSIPVRHFEDGHAQRWKAAHGLPSDARVIAFFGTISGAKQFDWVSAAWQEARKKGGTPSPIALVVLGNREDDPLDLAGIPHFLPLGYVSEDQVSAALQATDLLVLPFIDGVSERRTTFMAGLDHGVAVVTTIGPSTGPMLRAADFFRGTPCDQREEFVRAVDDLIGDEVARRALGSKAREAYRRCFDWNVVVAHLFRQIAPP